MKKGVSNWVWIVMVILVLLVIILFIQRNNLYNDYAGCVLGKIDDTKEYLDLSKDYLNLLICYQEGLPTCEQQIAKYGNASVFTQKV